MSGVAEICARSKIQQLCQSYGIGWDRCSDADRVQILRELQRQMLDEAESSYNPRARDFCRRVANLYTNELHQIELANRYK